MRTVDTMHRQLYNTWTVDTMHTQLVQDTVDTMQTVDTMRRDS